MNGCEFRPPLRRVLDLEHLVQHLLHLLRGTAPARLSLEQLPALHLAVQFVERLGDVVAAVRRRRLEEGARELGGRALSLSRRHAPLVLQVGLVGDNDARDVARAPLVVQETLDGRHRLEAVAVRGAVDDQEAVCRPDVTLGDGARHVAARARRVEDLQRRRLVVDRRLVRVRALWNTTDTL